MAGMDRLTWRRSTGAGVRVGGTFLDTMHDLLSSDDEDVEDTDESSSDSIETEIHKIQARYDEAQRKQYAMSVRRSDMEDYKAALAAQKSYYEDVFSKHVSSYRKEPSAPSTDAYWRPKFSKDREELDDLHDKVMSFKPWLSFSDGGADGGEGGGRGSGVETYGRESVSEASPPSHGVPRGGPDVNATTVAKAGVAGTALLVGGVVIGSYLLFWRKS